MSEFPQLLMKEESETKKDFLERVYKVFWEDFFYWREPLVENKKVKLKKGICQNKEYTFWHIISNDEKKGPNFERCQNIAWIRFMIENYQQMITWENERKSAKSLCIVDPEWNYLVVLRKRKDYYLLWTAYPLTSVRKQKLQKECQTKNA